jgi:hypothetical protein
MSVKSLRLGVPPLRHCGVCKHLGAILFLYNDPEPHEEAVGKAPADSAERGGKAMNFPDRSVPGPNPMPDPPIPPDPSPIPDPTPTPPNRPKPPDPAPFPGPPITIAIEKERSVVGTTGVPPHRSEILSVFGSK